MTKYCSERGMLLEELFTGSVCELVMAVNSRARIPIAELARFEEPEFSKTEQRITRGPLWKFVLRFADSRLVDLRMRRSGLLLGSDLRITFYVTRFLWMAGLRRRALRYAWHVARTIVAVVGGSVLALIGGRQSATGTRSSSS